MEKLIIFDFSGTLSLESTTFARPQTLMHHLVQSGLANLGINSPEIFWDQVVNPTWEEGSTTSAGYKKVMETRIRNLLYQNMSIVSCVNLTDAVSSFVESYLSHSRIDVRWHPLLQRLHKTPGVRVIIATDHYAEATDYIITFLRELDIHASSLRDPATPLNSVSFIVATSADLGCHKDTLRFWELIKSRLSLHEIRCIILIDDFGYNEQKGNAYGTPERIRKRIGDTVRLLQQVFATKVDTIPFMIEDTEKESHFERLVIKTSTLIDRYLSEEYEEIA